MITTEHVQNIKLNSAGKSFCAPDWSWDTQDFIKDFDIWVPICGRGSIRTGDMIHSISPGDCFVLRPYERYVFEQDHSYPFIVIYIHYNYIDASGKIYIPDESIVPAFHSNISNIKFFNELLERVAAAYSKGQSFINEAEQWLRSLLLEININQNILPYTGLELEQAHMIENICDLITKDPLGCSNINKLASKYSYSSDHLRRLFVKFKGITPSQFTITAKIDKAKDLLRSSSYSISRISQILGYKDIYHFSAQFRQKTGISPSNYRRN